MSFVQQSVLGLNVRFKHLNSVTKLIVTITNYLVTPTTATKPGLFVAQSGLCSVLNIMFVLTTLASFIFFSIF